MGRGMLGSGCLLPACSGLSHPPASTAEFAHLCCPPLPAWSPPAVTPHTMSGSLCFVFHTSTTPHTRQSLPPFSHASPGMPGSCERLCTPLLSPFFLIIGLITGSSSVEGQNRRLCCKKSHFNSLALPISAGCCLLQPPWPQRSPCPGVMPSGSCLLLPAAVITERLATIVIKAPHFLTPLALGAGTHLGHWFDLLRQSSGLWGLMKGLVVGGCILPVSSTSG